MRTLILLIIGCLIASQIGAQPQPCEVNAMSSTCTEACVVCDIDGFTGTNNLTLQGQTFPEFCTTIFHNMSYIAFIAGTVDLTLTVSVSNCTINRGVEIGIFESLDCQNFTPVTDCNTDVAPNGTATFSNLVPLVVGQHYYLILDGSMGDICDWTFNVIEGSTLVDDLTTSGMIEGPDKLCPDLATTYSTTGEVGATLFYWSLDGIVQNTLAQQIDITFPADGTYELCVTAANVCDEAPPTCTTITVVSPSPLFLDETLCFNECVQVAGETICETGTYDFLITLPNGCDSLIFLDLIILPASSSYLDINLCVGEDFSIASTSYSISGIFVEVIQTDLGCDSTVTLDLSMIDCEISGISDFASPICNGDQNGSLSFSLDNGTPPFKYEWSNIAVPNIQGSGITNLFLDNVIENIPAGVYEINVQDEFGNDVVFIQEVIDPPTLTLAIEISDFNGFNLTCHDSDDGSASVIGNGGVPPYSYEWSNNGSGRAISNLASGTYEVTIRDTIGCAVMKEFVMIEPDPLVFIVDFIDPTCDGYDTGIIQVASISGGTVPYSFALDNNPYDVSDTYLNLGSGSYDFTVLDANGCQADTTNDLLEIDIPELYMDENQVVDLGCSLSISASTNTTALTDIRWSDLENSLECDDCLSTIAAPVNDTKYILSVTSVDDCSTSDSLYVTVNKIRDVFSPNAFSPNNDGINEYFSLTPGKSVLLIKKNNVYDRWGSIVYEATDQSADIEQSGWDGYVNGQLAAVGVYVWVAEVEYLDGEILIVNGDVTLIL